jgi:hypothetical protein
MVIVALISWFLAVLFLMLMPRLFNCLILPRFKNIEILQALKMIKILTSFEAYIRINRWKSFTFAHF